MIRNLKHINQPKINFKKSKQLFNTIQKQQKALYKQNANQDQQDTATTSMIKNQQKNFINNNKNLNQKQKFTQSTIQNKNLNASTKSFFKDFELKAFMPEYQSLQKILSNQEYDEYFFLLTQEELELAAKFIQSKIKEDLEKSVLSQLAAAEALIFMIKENYPQSIQIYENIDISNDYHSQINYLKSLIHTKSFEKAQSSLESIPEEKIQENHDLLNEYYELKAQILFVQDKFTESIQVLKEFEEKNQNKLHPKLYNKMAFIYIHQKDILNALKSYDKAIELDKSYFQAYYNKGCYLQGLKDHAQAIQYFQKSIEINPNYDQTYLQNGLSLYETQQPVKAIENFEKYIQLGRNGTNFALVYYHLGLCLAQTGKFNEAIEKFDLSIQADDKFVKSYNNKGCALAELGKLKEAVECFEKLISIDNSDAEAYYYCGIASLQSGNQEKGVEYMKKATEIEPENQNYKMAYERVVSIINRKKQ